MLSPRLEFGCVSTNCFVLTRARKSWLLLRLSSPRVIYLASGLLYCCIFERSKLANGRTTLRKQQPAVRAAVSSVPCCVFADPCTMCPSCPCLWHQRGGVYDAIAVGNNALPRPSPWCREGSHPRTWASEAPSCGGRPTPWGNWAWRKMPDPPKMLMKCPNSPMMRDLGVHAAHVESALERPPPPPSRQQHSTCRTMLGVLHPSHPLLQQGQPAGALVDAEHVQPGRKYR